MNHCRNSIVAGMALLWIANSALGAEEAKVPLAHVKQDIDADKAVLVDVREKREWDSGHVKGAIFLPLSELQRDTEGKRLRDLLPKDKVLYTHCAVGKRALTAANILEKHGYTVLSLKPGYKELIAEGFEKAKD